MRRVLIILALLGLLALPVAAETYGRVKKVLPQLLDLQGRHTLSPSLYDRDAYQAKLRRNPELCSGLRFYILWKAWVPKGTQLKLRIEARGSAPGKLPFQKTVEHDFTMGSSKLARWTEITIDGDDFKKLGELTAWHVTLWEGDTLVAEQKSFLW